jgi:hypothetical protein
MTILDKPLSQQSEVVDKAQRRWKPDWYGWLSKMVDTLNYQLDHGSVADLKRDFGAKGGGADDTAAFNSAFDWLNDVAGRTLIIPPGENELGWVKTGTHIATKNNTSIIGYGSRASMIWQEDDNDSIVFQNASPATGINVGTYLSAFGIRRTCGSSASVGIDLRMRGQIQFVVKDLYFINAVNGVQLEGCGDGAIDGLHIDSNQDILVRRTGSALLNIVSQINAGAIVNHSGNLRFTNFQISGLGVNGFIDYAIQMSGGDTILFSNGHVGLTGQVGVLINPGSTTNEWFVNSAFENVFFDGTGFPSNSIVAVQSGNAGQTVQRLRFCNCLFGGAPTGLNLDYPTKDVVVIGNNFDDLSSFGIILNGGANTSGVSIIGNRFNITGTPYAGDALDNATTVIQGNSPDRVTTQTHPTVTAGSGTFTTVSCDLNQTKIDTMLYFEVKIAITTNGTAATDIRVATGITPLRDTGVSGCKVTLGIGVEGFLSTGGTMFIFGYDGSYAGGNGTVILIQGWCEIG